MFSIAGLLLNSKRSWMAPYKANMLSLVHDNYPKYFPVTKVKDKSGNFILSLTVIASEFEFWIGYWALINCLCLLNRPNNPDWTFKWPVTCWLKSHAIIIFYQATSLDYNVACSHAIAICMKWWHKWIAVSVFKLLIISW